MGINCIFPLYLFFKRKGGGGGEREKGKITCIPTIYSLKGESVTCMCDFSLTVLITFTHCL